jgi:LmbE family N-acetylglucosaminyl deacetylase
MTPTILAVFAHPDDESVCSGTLAMGADLGWRVVLAVATRGEAGEIEDSSLATPENLGAVRESEMKAACDVLGIDEICYFGYRDSGMAGTIENGLSNSLFHADPRQVTGKIIRLIRELHPQIVITFEPYGIYGHPDHVIISRCTTRAFDLAGKPSEFPDSGEPWQPSSLYYSVLPQVWFKSIRERMQVFRFDTTGVEQVIARVKENPHEIDHQITHKMDVTAYAQVKIDSLACHQTQLSPQSPFKNLLKPEMRDLMAQEFFIQVRPDDIEAGFFET